MPNKGKLAEQLLVDVELTGRKTTFIGLDGNSHDERCLLAGAPVPFFSRR